MRSEPLEAAVNQHPNCALTSSHDLGDLADGEVAEHPEQHCFGLIGGERSDQGKGPIEGVGTLGARRHGVGGAVDRVLSLALEAVVSALGGADVVDAASGRDREQPPTERRLVALETSEAARHLEPHDRRQILRVGHALAPEVAQQEMLVRAPQLGERIAVTRAGTSYHLLHGL